MKEHCDWTTIKTQHKYLLSYFQSNNLFFDSWWRSFEKYCGPTFVRDSFDRTFRQNLKDLKIADDKWIASAGEKNDI